MLNPVNIQGRCYLFVDKWGAIVTDNFIMNSYMRLEMAALVGFFICMASNHLVKYFVVVII